MKLRSILLILSLLAVLSAATGGYLYYSSLKEAAFAAAERQAVTRVRMLRKNISSYLSENVKSVRALAKMDQLLEILVRPDPEAQNNANAILDIFKKSLDVDVCYLMNYKGDTIASSNRNAPDSFVGKNFAFRPYFQMAIHSAPATYLALGITSNKRGVYYSYPVFEKGGDTPIGLVVIKASIELIEKELGLTPDEIVLVTDPQGIVFISNKRNWLYQATSRLSSEQKERIAGSRQFGNGPWDWIGLETMTDRLAMDTAGVEYLLHQTDIDNHPDWKIIHLRSLQAIARTVSAPLIRITGPIVLALCAFIGIAVSLLYKKASQEIFRRRTTEKALRESEKRYRSLYHQTPAMLHSIDPSGHIVSVSDYWSDVLGFEREAVIGKPLTHFFTKESRRYAEEEVFPEFFKSGFCKDIPYRYVKKDGQPVDVLLSAIVDRDEDGNIVRSLAVSMDVTERKRAEEALKEAKEELSRYSKDLERQVRKRTRELRRLSGSIMTNQEKERAAIARELHDELGQVLTALRMDSVWLYDRLKTADRPAAERALTIRNLIDKNIEDVRGMARRLRPGVLDDLGLVDALEWYTTDFERRTEITCIFDHDQVPRLDDAVATAAYRITQEALTNIARHAEASRVEVSIKLDNGILQVLVADDGCGFKPRKLSESEGLGVPGMRERASLVGGLLEVWSTPQKGTRVSLSVPLNDRKGVAL